MCFVAFDKHPILEAPRINGLYQLPAHPVASPAEDGACFITVKSPEETPELWHRRMGHLHYRALARLPSMVTGAKLAAGAVEDAASQPCEPCILGKQDRRPFKQSERATSKPLELVHMDVVGPISLPTLDNARYVLTVLDDYSGFCAVETVASKAAVPGVISTLLPLLEVQCGHQLQALRTDRGTEFLNNVVANLLQHRGAVHQTSVPYTPQQNGKAERLNRTLVEMVRSMLAATDLPYSLWGEAIETAAYLRNRSPTSKRPLTPFELFTGMKPDLSHLRVWGCNAWAKLLVSREGKFAPVATPCRLVGYCLNSKAYRVYLPDSEQVMDHRDVLFDEEAPLKGGEEHREPVPWEHVVQPFYEPVSSPSVDLDQTTPMPEVPEPSLGAPHSRVNSPRPVPVEEGGLESRAELRTPVGSPSGSPVAPSPPADSPTSKDVAESLGSILNAEGHRTSARLQGGAAHAVFSEDLSAPPRSYAEAMSRPDAEHWRLAMEDEMASQHSNETWELVRLPPGAKTLPVMWVYTCKRDDRGNIVRYKARLVAKGFRQREGVDYTEVFAPVSKYATLRSLLAVVAQRNLELHQLDIKTAFLNAELHEEIYINQPPGYDDGTGHVCWLKKALYGLKQSPRVWYDTLATQLASLGFKASTADTALFIRDDCTLLVYVDDILIAAPDLETVKSIKSTLSGIFDVRDLGEARVFLGMEVERDRVLGTLRLSQRAYTQSVLAQFGMSSAKPKSTPMDLSARLVKATRPDELCDVNDKATYMSIVGSLLYLSICTRPDIAQAVGVLSRFMSCPTPAHLSAAKGVLRYLVGMPALGILYRVSDPAFGLVGFCDADYAGDVSTRRSTTGYVFLVCGGAVSWASRMQATVAASTTEAEYMAASMITKEALWLRNLLVDLGVPVSGPMPVKCDNMAALHLIKQPVVSSRAKHIDVMHHFVRERVLRGELFFSYVASGQMVADCLTKPLPPTVFTAARTALGMI
jgi:transposase InsO family protein